MTDRRALLIVDVQNDFVEGGSLGVDGGKAVAAAISDYLADHADDYVAVIASRDWHDPHTDNGGHFATPDLDPDFSARWPAHCVAGTPGAEYVADLDQAFISHHLVKGMGEPAYSMFEGAHGDGTRLADLLADLRVGAVDVAGIATDYCVRATCLDARGHRLDVRLLHDLAAGVAPDSTAAALEEMRAAGVRLDTTADIT